MSTSSMFARRRNLLDHIQRGALGPQVVKELLLEGEPMEFEHGLWDYKRELPDLSSPDGNQKAVARLVKTVVAFYNTYGGYLLVGVDDRSRKLVGYSESFDCDRLKNKVFAYTKTVIDCSFVSIAWDQNGNSIPLGLLHIPQRSHDELPVSFRKAFHLSDGSLAWQAGQFYFRRSHECVPASSAEDFALLLTAKRWHLARPDDHQRVSVLDHNLPDRDPELVRFVGRYEELDELWRWLADRFNPVKVLAGMGGVGKTTLAREFAGQMVDDPPRGIDKLIWLSAKKTYYFPSRNKETETRGIDFSRVRK